MAVSSARKVEGGGSEHREARRLEAVQALDILDTPHEEPYDRIVRLVRTIFNVDIAFIAIIDAHRQWYKAVSGTRPSVVWKAKRCRSTRPSACTP